MKINFNLPLIYSAVGHAFMHMFASFYAVIVLSLEKDWQLSYDDLLQLWIFGSLLIGLAAIPAGWLSDRWSRSGMMLVMFLGLGLASLLCGLSTNEFTLFIGLTFLGLFCAIYHPVAIAWVVNTSKKKGMALGINGIFGLAGIGVGAIITGLIIDEINWQAAFIIPAIISLLVFCSLGCHLLLKKIPLQNTSNSVSVDSKKPAQLIKIALIMLVSIFCLGLVFQMTQTAVPKLLEIRLAPKLNLQTFGIGILIAIIYGTGGMFSLLGGWLADRYPLKLVYVSGIIIQAPFLFLAAQTFNISLIFLLLFAIIFNSSILPAENILLASFTPHKYHGLIYGCKFILAFGAAPVAVFLVAKFYEINREFINLFIFGGLLLFGVFLLGLFLPLKKPKPS